MASEKLGYLVMSVDASFLKALGSILDGDFQLFFFVKSASSMILYLAWEQAINGKNEGEKKG